MTFAIRRAEDRDLETVNALCLRSKAVWGYDAAFVDACREELTLGPADLQETSVVVALRGGDIAAMAQVGITGETADLLKLFVDPAALGSGLGRALFDWAVSEARELGALRLSIEADPQAVLFYKRMGAREIGRIASCSIPERQIPLLSFRLV